MRGRLLFKNLKIIYVLGEMGSDSGVCVEIRGSWRSRGSLWTLGSRLGPGGPCQTIRFFIWDPEVFSPGPGTETGARRRCGNPEILYLDPEIVVGTLRFL